MTMALFLYFFVIFCLSTLGSQEILRCADPKCEDPISEARGKLSYTADVEGKVSFKIGDKVVVYSKTNGDLWGVEVNGKRGFASKALLQEERTFHKDLRFEVSMKFMGQKTDKSVDAQENSDQPEITKSYIFDGTVVYTNSTDDLGVESINPTSSVFVQSTASENLKVTPTKLSTDYHGISPHEIIKSDENEIQEDLNEKRSEGSEEVNKLKLFKKSVSEDVKPFSSQSGIQGDENKESEYNHEESDKDLEYGDDDEEEEEEDEEEDTEEVSEKEDGEDKTLSENEGTNYKKEETFNSEQINAENIVLEASQAAVVDGESGNDSNSILSTVDNLRNEAILGSNSNPLKSEIVLTSQSQHLEQNDIEMSAKTKDSKESETTVETERTSGNEKSKGTMGTEGTGGTKRNKETERFMGTEENGGTEGNKETEETMKTEENGGTEGNKETEETMGPKENGGTIGNKETEYTMETEENEKTMENEESKTSMSNAEERGNEETLWNMGIAGNQGAVGNDVAKNVETEETTLSEGSKEIEIAEGTKKTEDIKETVSNINIENTAPSPSDNSMMPLELLNGAKDEIREQIFSNLGEGHSDIKSEEISSEKSEHEPVSITNEVNRLISFRSGRELVNQLVSEDYSPVVTMIDNEAERYSEETQDSNYETIDGIDHLSKVQGTCESESSGCIPNGDLPEQLPPTLDVEQGWFATLTQVSKLELLYLTWASMMEGHKSSFDTLVFLIIAGSSIVLFLLGFYYLEKHRRDGSLLAKISSLEKELMVAAQEKFVLNDELEKAKEKLTSGGDFATSDSDDVATLKTELEEYKIARSELEEQVMSLEKELETATEAGLELNKMMSELLSQQHGSDTKDLMQSVEHLQKQLDSQQTTISTMNQRLTAKTRENENLQSELNASASRVVTLEEQLAKVKETLRNMQKEKLDVENDFKAKNQSIEKQLMETLESKSAESQRLQNELYSLQDILDETRKNLAEREGEVSVLRESLGQAECLTKDGDFTVSLESLLDVGKLRVQIESLSKERDDLKEKLQGEEDARKLLEDHMKIVSEEVSTLHAKYEEADHGKAEAQTRLEILSNYFKEKETQLQKELGLQEAMYIQKEGDALTTIERIKAFQEEIESYKSHNEILKKEIVDQEKSMKSKIAMLEKEVHENWIAARQMERRLEESKREASQLRNRLTLSGRRLVGTIPGPEVGKSPDRDLEYNGEMSASPAHLGESQELQSSPMHFGHPASPPLLPPTGQQINSGSFPGMPLFLPMGAPPLPFPMPPPPGNIFPEDLRPPPLGRMSSPPPEPHSSFSPFNNSPPMSPHGRPYRSPIHYEDSPSRFRQPPQSSSSFSYNSPYPPSKWDESPRSSFRPLHRDSPREPKGSTISSGHSSESLDKGSRHSDRV